MGPKEKLKSGKQKVEIPMKSSRSPLLFPLFLYLARVFGLWPETFCREPGEPFIPFPDNNRHLFQTVGPCCSPSRRLRARGCAAIPAAQAPRKLSGQATALPIAPIVSGIGMSPAFIREDQSARRRLTRPGRSRSPFLFQLSGFNFPTGHLGAAELVRSGHAP
jgi:hypothetical protein